MKDQAFDMATKSAGDGVAWILLAIGWQYQTHEYVGGIMFAFGMAMMARHWFPMKDRREIWLTLLAAFLCSTFGAELFFAYFPENIVPKQAVMAGFGLASPVIVTLVLQVMLRVEARQTEIADSLIDRVLPPKKDTDE